jgi:hypothetical protein
MSVSSNRQRKCLPGPIDLLVASRRLTFIPHAVLLVLRVYRIDRPLGVRALPSRLSHFDVARKYSSRTSVISAHPDWKRGIVGLKIGRVVDAHGRPVFLRAKKKEKSGAAWARYAKSSAAITAGHIVTFPAPATRSRAGNIRFTGAGSLRIASK